MSKPISRTTASVATMTAKTNATQLLLQLNHFIRRLPSYDSTLVATRLFDFISPIFPNKRSKHAGGATVVNNGRYGVSTFEGSPA